MRLIFVSLAFLLLLFPVEASVTGELKLNIISPCYWVALSNWNFFSFCAEIQNKSVSNVTMPIKDNFDYILRWNSSSQAYELYSIFSSNNPFNEFDLNESYFFHFLSPANLTLAGPMRGDLNISLKQFWNAPTYPYEFPSNVSIYLATIEGFKYMLKWNAALQAYVLYSAYSSANPFSQINATEGQFIYTNASNATLVYNRTQLKG